MLNLDLWESKPLYNALKNHTERILENKRIILYGLGAFGDLFLKNVVKKYKLKIEAIIDRKFKKGNFFYGVPIFSPTDYILEDKNKDSIAIVAVSDREQHEEIFSLLKNMGFENIAVISDFYECQTPFLSNELLDAGFDYYVKNKNKILNALSLFFDKQSIEVYSGFMQTHMQRKAVYIPHRPVVNQYFPTDIKLNKGYKRFINCGAYIGDTIKQLNIIHGKIDSLVCFEPDLKNYKVLIQYLGEHHESIAQEIIPIPCGVYDDEVILSFSTGDKTASTLSAMGKNLVQCVSLDNILLSYSPTFISMDVEGAELKALQGAEKIIKGCKPDLAICVYHYPNDVWDIPLYINSLNLGYRFYLRNYTGFAYETVLYATT